MRIVFFGTPDFAVPSLDALADAGHDLACVVSQPDRPSGRRRRLTAPPVKERALALGLPLRQTADVNDARFVDALAALAPEVMVVAAFGQKFGPRLLRLAPHGCLNVHASLLPRHRGAAPVAHAILADDRQTGVTILRMAEGMDTGDVLAQAATPIGPRETAGELGRRLARLGARLLVATLDRLAAGRVSPTPQDHGAATLAPSLRKKDGEIDWSRPADALDRFVRAMSPWPGAFTFWHRPDAAPLRIVVHEAEPLEGAANQPGRVAEAQDETLAVETGEGLLAIRRLQPAGKRPMAAADFLRGHPMQPGQRLGGKERAGEKRA
ncbi:MAG: methionyl-tRNA formyltransferase [Candidatus Brocadiia bacterium]